MDISGPQNKFFEELGKIMCALRFDTTD